MVKLSAAGDQHNYHLDMLTMMMQMEKPPHELDLCIDPASFQDIDFSASASSSSSSSIMLNNHNLQPNQNAVSVCQPSSVSFPPLYNQPIKTTTASAISYEKRNSMAAMREMIFRIAAMQPVHIDPESVKAPKRRNVKISKDPQSVAARHRRERISERIRILQRLVPGGTKMDTASMLDEAVHYVKFLKKQVQTLQQASGANRSMPVGLPGSHLGNLNFQPSRLLGGSYAYV